MNLLTAALILALIPPPAAAPIGPSPSPSPGGGLRTIATVKASPYCTSLVTHYTGAMRPMVANDFALDRVDDQLISFQDTFTGVDRTQHFVEIRLKLQKLVGDMLKRMSGEQDEINQLRDTEKLTKDSAEAAQVHALAEKMQSAYTKQRAMSSDLTSFVQSMMDYFPGDQNGDMTGFNNAWSGFAQENKDIKSSLRFDGQRDLIRTAENDAGDIAYDAATAHCM